MAVRVLIRAAPLVVLAAACQSPMPSVRSLSFDTIPERTTRTLVLITSQCAPPFDLDRGTIAQDPTAQVQLDPGARVLAATRTGDEQFETDVPDDLRPGAYELQLRLSDGRAARYDGQLTVTGGDAVIVAVTSAATTVTPGQTGVPLDVTVSNPGLCAVDGLVVAPTFVRGAADASADFVVHAPGPVHLEPGAQSAVSFTVDVATSAVPGVVRLDASGAGGQRTGASCSGAVSAGASGSTTSWTVVPLASNAQLQVTSVRANPDTPHAGMPFNVVAQVQNLASVAVTVQSFAVTSDPPGVVSGDTFTPVLHTLDPFAVGTFTVNAMLPGDAVEGSTYTLAVACTASDSTGTVYTTRPGAPTAQVTASH